MISIKNRGIGISTGGVDTSLMMMKSNPEFFLNVKLSHIPLYGYSNTARANGLPTEYIKENNPKETTVSKTFICNDGYTVVTVNPQEG